MIDKFCAMYEYWMCEWIGLEFHPCRWHSTPVQTGISWLQAKMPTVSCIDGARPLPVLSPATGHGQEDIYRAMAGKGNAIFSHPLQSVKRSLTVDQNLLLKESHPMLKTNGSFALRHVYDATQLSSVMIMPSVTKVIEGNSQHMDLGIMVFKQRLRFAGLKVPGGPLSVLRPSLPQLQPALPPVPPAEPKVAP